MSKGDGSGDANDDLTASAAITVPAEDKAVERPVVVEESTLALSWKTFTYGCYLVFFTTLWFLSGESCCSRFSLSHSKRRCADPGYTLYAKFGFKSSTKIWPNPLIPVMTVLWWQMSASSLVSLLISAPVLRSRVPELKEAIFPGRASLIMIGLNAGAQGLQMAAVGWGSLSFSQVVRAMEPIFLLFWFKVSKTPVDTILYVSTMPIYVGAILSAGTEHHFSWIALCAGTLSNFLLTGRNFFLKLAMSDEKDLPVSLLLFQTSLLPAIASSMFILALIFTGIPVFGSFFDPNFIYSGLMFSVMRYSSLLMLKELSLLAHSLLKLSRRIVVIVIAYLMWHAQVDAVHVCGMSMTLLGAACAEMVKRFQTWKMLIICFLLVFGFSGLSIVVTNALASGKYVGFLRAVNKTFS